MERMVVRTRLLALPIALAAVMASGCGGGGGGSGPGQPISTPPPTPSPTPTPTPTPSFNDSEYQASNSAVLANALPAHQAGASGSGVKVAVIDTGINPNLPEFIGRIDPASQDVAANRGIVDHQGHGSLVSGVIAANRDGSYMEGVAFGATILSLNVYDPAGCKPNNDCFLDASLPGAIDLARINGARIINMSFGDEEGMTEDIYPAIRRAVDAGILIVMSAGNAGIADPNSFAVRNINQDGASGLFIIAGAIDANRSISSFSNRAGSGPGAASYLTALGRGNATVNQFGAHVNVNGTSFSAPTIAGAAALLAGAFPNLTGAQIVSLLLSTADDAGAVGTDAIYGRGILNIGRAFQPQGTATLAGSASAISMTSNGMSSGPIGDARSSGASAIILDGYSRAFALDLAQTMGRMPQEQPLRQAINGVIHRTSGLALGPVSVTLTVRRNVAGQSVVGSSQMSLSPADRDQAKAIAGSIVSRLTPRTALAFGFSQNGRGLQQQLARFSDNAFLVARDPASSVGFNPNPHTSFGIRHDFGPLAVSLFSERGKARTMTRFDELRAPPYSLSALTLDRRIGQARLSLVASRLNEDETVLGSRFSGLLAHRGSLSTFVDTAASVELGRRWTAYASYRRGWTSVAGGGGLVDHGRLVSQAFAFDLAKSRMFATGDRFALRVLQPLRVSRGGLDLTVPVGYDYATREVSYGNRTFNLAPTGREVDYEVAYGIAMLGGYLDLNAFLRTEPGNIRARNRDIGAAIRFIAH